MPFISTHSFGWVSEKSVQESIEENQSENMLSSRKMAFHKVIGIEKGYRYWCILLFQINTLALGMLQQVFYVYGYLIYESGNNERLTQYTLSNHATFRCIR